MLLALGANTEVAKAKIISAVQCYMAGFGERVVICKLLSQAQELSQIIWERKVLHAELAESIKRRVRSPFASIRRSRKNGQCVRLNSTRSRSHGVTITSSRSIDALNLTVPSG